MVRFRSGLVSRLVREGWQVLAIADLHEEDAERIRALGAEVARVPIQGSGTNPLRDLRYLRDVLRVYRRWPGTSASPCSAAACW